MQRWSISQTLPFPLRCSGPKILLLCCSWDTQHQLPSHFLSLCRMSSPPATFAQLCAGLHCSPPAHPAAPAAARHHREPSLMPHTLPALGGLSVLSLTFIFSRCCSADPWTKTSFIISRSWHICLHPSSDSTETFTDCFCHVCSSINHFTTSVY